VNYLLAAAVGYLLGSLPFGWLVARMHGVDIFAVGSRSPGATNVRRVLGARAGNQVFFLDALKGAAAAGWPALVSRHGLSLQDFALERNLHVPFCLISLGAALVGHSFSCFTRFKGGKGVATGTGGLLVLLPGSTLIAAVVWIVAFYATGYVSLASILAAVTLPSAAYFFGNRALLVVAAIAISLFVIGRHRANIGRLMSGTENKFQKKKEDEA
jgi:acyl phosphate:glycerol-3-phosphate acyltransferase